ncbi:septum formation protein [Anaerobacterium chartisolvens]|uniref:dTTP/UTP pyrophosphatase n=1 Tax=Anaerobacterium chartisolvens TaxID=1297424 RepID=A0A369BGY7_9FIRM|nr:Maf family protein [Anaerobacterium chartisolvens]RCX20813.1 septum formation protein [Anaerobacterium chartisolvens]
MKQIILASASPRRVELMKQLGTEFEVIPSNVEETVDASLMPHETAKKLALEKASDVAGKHGRGALVIGADTIVVSSGIMGKPRDEVHAFEMLKALQGGWHEVITGIAVIDSLDMRLENDYVATRVKMIRMSNEMIRSYIATKEPMDKAGAYGIQGMGAVIVEKIEGCYFNVVGLPLMRLSSMLRSFGVKILE